jgi:cytochrome c oxidase assembly protein subunit 15
LGRHVLLSLVVAQIALGIATLVHIVPLPLAAMHQAGAVLVFAAASTSRTRLR